MKKRTVPQGKAKAEGVNEYLGSALKPRERRTLLTLTLSGILFFGVGLSLQVNAVVPLFLLLVLAFFVMLYPDYPSKPYRLLNVALLYVCGFASAAFIQSAGWPQGLVPYAIVPLLAAILFNDLVIPFLLSAALAVSVGGLSIRPFDEVMLFLISGILAPLLVIGARRRPTIINAGLAVGLVLAASSFMLSSFAWEPKHYLRLIFNGAATGIIAAGILPVFEFLFDTVTNIKLLELADFNHPLLNRLMLEAPGTYHHSLIVGNLSEAAAKAVGANSLLARIGSYYHDIGKLQKPNYFAENQNIRSNVHETLAPSMSKLVIMNHVKEGVELAKRYRLNSILTDFILQHHGRSLVYFFYRRALENSEDTEKLAEEGFRYPGPKPRSKETAIVLLADSVEAAARALKEPTHPNIEELVHKIINNKFIDGQLDECDLTLKDLEKISEVFIHILNGIYHSRVDYPEQRSVSR